MLHFYYQLLLLYRIISPRQANQIMLLFYMGTLTGNTSIGLCQLPRDMGVPGIQLCHGSISTPQKRGNAWHSTLSWVNVNSSIDMGVPGIRLCHGSMSTPQKRGSAWHSTLPWVNVNSSIDVGVPDIRLCHGSMSTPPEHGSAWQLTRSWVDVNSSSIRECLVSMPTPSRGVETHCSVID